MNKIRQYLFLPLFLFRGPLFRGPLFRGALLSGALLFPGLLRAQDVPVPAKPTPERLVNDIAHVMTPDQVSALEHKLVGYDDSTSNQIVIVTMPTIGDQDIEEFSVKLFKAWGIGNKKTNNGVLIMVTIDNRKIFITTGYGLEGAIPDVTARSIIDNEIVPNFRSATGDNYYRGFSHAADALIKAAAGEYKAPEGYAERGGRRHGRKSVGNGIGIFLIIFVVIVVLSIFRGGRGGGGGGYFGGGGFLPFLLGTMVGRGLGGGGGGSGDWGGGGGGDSGGGDFGGFGGGDTGGGGAGGSW